MLGRYINPPFLVLDLSLLPGPIDDVSNLDFAKLGFFPDRGHGNAFLASPHNPHHRFKWRLGLFCPWRGLFGGGLLSGLFEQFPGRLLFHGKHSYPHPAKPE